MHGGSSTGKSHPFNLLALVTPCYSGNLDNLTESTDHDWIFITDFHDNVEIESLITLCDGPTPLVFDSNKLPLYSDADPRRVSALYDRLEPVAFTHHVAGELCVENLCAFIVTLL
jgi:hypothetical protein